MDVQDFLFITLQLLLTGGVGGVFILAYATKDIFLTDEEPPLEGPRFASDYEELMWLADRQRLHINEKETKRFYQLRQEWPDMHSSPVVGPTLI